MENITLLITIFDANICDLSKWIKFYRENRKTVDIFFLLDNPTYEYKTILEDYIENKNLFINEVNIGKFSTVLNFICDNNIKTNHFKIVDPDDCISMEHLMTIDGKLCDSKTIYLLNSTITKKRKIFIDKDITKLIDKKQKKDSLTFANRWTIYPTNILLKQEIYSNKDRINSSDDKLLGYIALFSGAKVSRIDSNFYLYFNNIGESSVKNYANFIENEFVTYLNIIILKGKSSYEDITEYKQTIDWYFKRKKMFIRSLIYFKLSKQEKRNFKKSFNGLIELLYKLWKS